MCGRFAFWAHKNTVIRHFQLDAAPDYRTSYNITPTSDIPVICLQPERKLINCHWGLIPSWASDSRIKPINARAETLADRPFFRDAFRHRRCLIPANGFYEWAGVKGQKQPYFITPGPGGLFAFAGLWDTSRAGEGMSNSCTIITTAANRSMERIHDRMPVIIEPEDYTRWLQHGSAELLVPYAGSLQAHPVSNLVNNPAADSEQLTVPLPGTDAG